MADGEVGDIDLLECGLGDVGGEALVVKFEGDDVGLTGFVVEAGTILGEGVGVAGRQAPA